MARSAAADCEGVRAFCAEVSHVADSGRLADALEMIVNLVISVISDDRSLGRVFSSPDLDELCLGLGRRNRTAPTSLPDQRRAVFLVTAVAAAGGHTRVLQDLMKADPGCESTVLITSTNHNMRHEDAASLLAALGPGVELAPEGNLAERLAWAQRRLEELRPGRTYILPHHYDPVCIAAAQPELTGQLFYCHNCDHSLALGVHLPHAVHVDFHGKGYHYCRQMRGVGRNVYWPLTTFQPPPPDRAFLQHGVMTTCTSGGIEKFRNPFLAARLPYLYEYVQVLPAIIEATGGRHIHIGQLNQELLDSITRGLTLRGISRERFVHIPYVPHLASAFHEHAVDLYVGSFPFGGGRAVVEAMAAGLPLAIHSNYRSIFFTDAGEAYPGAIVWRTPDELMDRLGRMTRVDLAQHSLSARRHFEVHHAPEILAHAVTRTVEGLEPPVPACPTHVADQLQHWIDDERFLRLIKDRSDSLALKDECDSLRRQLDAVLHSTSWRVTYPLRMLRQVTRVLTR